MVGNDPKSAAQFSHNCRLYTAWCSLGIVLPVRALFGLHNRSVRGPRQIRLPQYRVGGASRGVSRLGCVAEGLVASITTR
jgi:hypothetical protein